MKMPAPHKLYTLIPEDLDKRIINVIFDMIAGEQINTVLELPKL